MDATLRTMLKRWASDNGLQLSYQVGSDFTLHQPVAKVRTNDLQSAMGELSTIYSPQGVSISADGKQILVQATSAAAPATTGPR
ncbi:TcpQ domain-containing protein [Variovorax paradoxus]|uniref:TcpQ domain-containing protein n=1 Tax=Variovorax paradoxus TaxID=34073 RepID=UPI003D6524A5